jgi:hypothetical protein
MEKYEKRFPEVIKILEDGLEIRSNSILSLRWTFGKSQALCWKG